MSSLPPTADHFTVELQRISGLIEAKELLQAAHALNAAQQQATSDPRVFLLGMRLAEQAGNLENAIKAARRALALAPQWHIAQIELALLLARQNQSDEAIQLATQALAAAPNDAHVMAVAINTAHFAKRREQLQAWAEESVRRFSDADDLGLRMFLAQYLANQRRYGEAIEHFEYIGQRVPHHPVVLRGLLNCALNVGGHEEKARAYADQLLAVVPDEPSAIYWHAVAHGKTPLTQPHDLVSGLFDEFAETFDRHVVRDLQYRVPERMAEILRDTYPDRRFNLLDLGCGTGLVGVYLQHTIGRIEGALIGVDLSEKMIEQAARHGIYARFHQVNVLDALEATPAQHYEVITCADVLIYVGDLAPVVPNALRILKPDGYFLFSCEAAGEDEADLVLREKTNRYSHKATAVERLCREAGFDEVTIEHLPALRVENGEPVSGFLVIAHRPAA